MIDPHESSGSPFIPDRRNHGRQKVLFSSVIISENNRGRVLNICPNGLALQTAAELIEAEFPIRFHFSQSQPGFEARGRIAWRSASRKVVGIEFIGPTDEVRKQIQKWIASQSDSSDSQKSRTSLEEAKAVTGAETSSKSATAIPAFAPELVDAIAANRVTSGTGKAGRRVGLLLAVALLLLAFLGFRYHLEKVENNQKGREMTAKPNLPGLSSRSSATPTSNAGPSLDHPAPTSNPRPSPDHPAFVLQVGAMVHEENADALAESLSQINFPAFVVKNPTDRFYRVLVGPYNGADAADGPKKELEKRGFKAIRTEWKAKPR
jgi:cell division septation protein DedD